VQALDAFYLEKSGRGFARPEQVKDDQKAPTEELMPDVDPASKVIDDYLKKLPNPSLFETLGENVYKVANHESVHRTDGNFLWSSSVLFLVGIGTVEVSTWRFGTPIEEPRQPSHSPPNPKAVDSDDHRRSESFTFHASPKAIERPG
jgi:hypothetical protein